MKIRRLLISLALAIPLGVACTRPPSDVATSLARPAHGAPAAFVGTDVARFVFPTGAPVRFLPTQEDSALGYVDQGFIWEVRWDVGGRVGSVPHGVEVRGQLPAVVPGQDSLAAVLVRARTSHEVFCTSCTTPASRLVPEPALTAVARDGQVLLTLRGRDALRRLWPGGAPDTVTLWWRGPGPQRESVKVPLTRRR